MAMRSVAKVDVSLGLFSFPVGVYKSTDDATTGIGFRQVHSVCGKPIAQKRTCAHCDNHDVSFADIRKGFEVGPDQFITIADEELKALRPEKDGVLEVLGFMEPDGLGDTRYVETSYFLMPGGKDATTFATFRESLGGRYAVGRVVLYGRDHIVAIEAFYAGLMMHVLRSKAELRDITEAPSYGKIPTTAREDHCTLMRQFMDMKQVRLADVAIAKDRYVTAVEQLIEAKRAGTELPAPTAIEPSAGPTVDLMAALRASLEAAGARA